MIIATVLLQSKFITISNLVQNRGVYKGLIDVEILYKFTFTMDPQN